VLPRMPISNIRSGPYLQRRNDKGDIVRSN
jgi:hypothetical protein